ncbi:hypothetical protein CSW37_11030 [Thermus scotoductus]|jgi:hypothetical protein|uniref:DUF2007 domain-containing protein n=2 Tax=Thermus scotoductus TaxID=37636 RepID=A0A348XQ98_THESC|nr:MULTISPECIES: hypothetical protein [Thermus]ADW22992.1 conserved hypothetical protein [Thermus scotoductus SA-01]RTG96296.1 hypothetical protein CSW48_04275 [Thermus scotoductus]RTG97399.1 hypothetical protein CSW49_03005 [Thermus scotoductus]RTH03547.1 hypothetical protein CSW50_04900 [Thermus scotoductus]RTH03550.1 hypothetical protein CSW47_08480 [Thermus scotoductus]
MERRLIAGTPYRKLLTAPRPVAEGMKARLEARGIPVVLETPFSGLPEAALGTYMGDVNLFVPEALLGEAEAALEEEIP